jgi:hypothetical protein
MSASEFVAERPPVQADTVGTPPGWLSTFSRTSPTGQANRNRLAGGFIVLYLGILGFGLMSHTLGFLNTAHPAMYYIVWDMFCGWSPYNNKHHIIAQGESGTYYDLAPPPWGSLRPWGAWDRQHYDPWNNHMVRMGTTTLRYTEHEPISKIWVVEEIWAKKYDLPDAIWNRRYDEAKDPYSYYRVRSESTGDGQLIASYISWAQYQQMVALGDNPRLYAESQRNRPMFMVEGQRPGQDVFIQSVAGSSSGMGRPQVANPLGN